MTEKSKKVDTQSVSLLCLSWSSGKGRCGAHSVPSHPPLTTGPACGGCPHYEGCSRAPSHIKTKGPVPWTLPRSPWHAPMPRSARSWCPGHTLLAAGTLFRSPPRAKWAPGFLLPMAAPHRAPSRSKPLDLSSTNVEARYTEGKSFEKAGQEK